MIEQASSPSLIPVLVTGIQQRRVRTAHDQSNQHMRSAVKKVPTGLPTQAGWIPVTSTGMRALAASSQVPGGKLPSGRTAIGMTECKTA